MKSILSRVVGLSAAAVLAVPVTIGVTAHAAAELPPSLPTLAPQWAVADRTSDRSGFLAGPDLEYDGPAMVTPRRS